MEKVSCRAQWHSLPGHLIWVLQGCHLCVPSFCTWASIVVYMSVGQANSQANWLTTIDELLCKDWPHGVGVTLAGPLVYLVCPVCSLGVSIVRFTGWGSDGIWSLPLHLLGLEPLRRSSGVDQGWLPLVLDLVVLGRSYARNRSWLWLVLDLRPFSGCNDAIWGLLSFVLGLQLLSWSYVTGQYWLHLCQVWGHLIGVIMQIETDHHFC